MIAMLMLAVLLVGSIGYIVQAEVKLNIKTDSLRLERNERIVEGLLGDAALRSLKPIGPGGEYLPPIGTTLTDSNQILGQTMPDFLAMPKSISANNKILYCPVGSQKTEEGSGDLMQIPDSSLYNYSIEPITVNGWPFVYSSSLYNIPPDYNKNVVAFILITKNGWQGASCQNIQYVSTRFLVPGRADKVIPVIAPEAKTAPVDPSPGPGKPVDPPKPDPSDPANPSESVCKKVKPIYWLFPWFWKCLSLWPWLR